MQKLKTLPIIFFSLSVIFLICLYIYFTQLDHSNQTSSTGKHSIHYIHNIHYTNDEYNFSLELPESWKDVKVIPSSKEPVLQYDEVTMQQKFIEQRKSISFLLKTSAEEYEEVFVINIHPLEEWEAQEGKEIFDKSVNPEGGIIGGYLGESNEYAYTYLVGGSRSDFVGFEKTNSDFFYGPHKDVVNLIISTFEITSI